MNLRNQISKVMKLNNEEANFYANKQMFIKALASGTHDCTQFDIKGECLPSQASKFED